MHSVKLIQNSIQKTKVVFNLEAMSLIVILGPTAVGKTRLAVALANEVGGEIISADSRQVYEGMDIGTGKDLEDFTVAERTIPHHLIDIRKAGEEYNLFNFQQDFYRAFNTIQNRNKKAILCGGTGMYLQAALAKEALLEVPENKKLRQRLENYSQIELNEEIHNLTSETHNTTDLEDRKRTIRAIEIELFKKDFKAKKGQSPVKRKIIFGLKEEREILRERIKVRLEDRLNNGMIEEVESLLKSGVSHEQLNYYGLEYRFISQYLQGSWNKEEMFEKLLQAIRRFSKKQMTWFRRMEKQRHNINWIAASLPMDKKLEIIKQKLDGK